jgi:hypothetical protein
MDLSNVDLQNICKEQGLPVADKHVKNIQTLFAYIKKLDSETKPPMIERIKQTYGDTFDVEEDLHGRKKVNLRPVPGSNEHF